MIVRKPARHELEDVWRERVNDALRRYRIGKLEANAKPVQIRNGEMPPPDGNFAFRKSTTARKYGGGRIQASVGYFNDLILNCKMPE